MSSSFVGAAPAASVAYVNASASASSSSSSSTVVSAPGGLSIDENDNIILRLHDPLLIFKQAQRDIQVSKSLMEGKKFQDLINFIPVEVKGIQIKSVLFIYDHVLQRPSYSFDNEIRANGAVVFYMANPEGSDYFATFRNK
jgi:hypothetical protein